MSQRARAVVVALWRLSLAPLLAPPGAPSGTPLTPRVEAPSLAEPPLPARPRPHRLWLFGLLWVLSGAAAATTTINHGFSPATIDQGDASSYRITVANDAQVALTDAAVTVLLPSAIVIADPQSIGTNSCGFTVSAAAPGTSRVYLTAGTIPASTGAVDGICEFELGVRSVTPGNHVANIPANSTPDASTAGYRALESGTPVFNSTDANATLSVSGLQPPTGGKSFTPSPAIAGDATRLSITLSNPNPGASIPLTSFTDTLPTGMVIADPADASSSCSGPGAVDGSLAAGVGGDSITLTGGTIGEGGSCTIGVDIVAEAVGSLTNSLAEGAIGNTRGLTSPAFSADLTATTPIGVSKSLGADLIPAGQPVPMTIGIANNSLTAPLDITSFTDDLTGTTLLIRDTLSSPAAPANPTVTCTGSGAVNGSLGYMADTEDTALTLTGAIAGPGGTCTISAYVTSLVDGEHTNAIPADAVQNPGNLPSPAASASVTVNAELTVDKSVSLSNVAPGQWTRFTVTIRNWSSGPVDNVSFVDDLPADGGNQMVLRGSNPVSSVGCQGGTFTGADGETQLSWSGGTIVAGSGLDPGVCTVVFDARLPADAPNGLTFTNQIPQGGICGEDVDGEQICNTGPSPAVNTLSVNSVAVNKSFSPASIPQGGQSTLTIRIRNRVVEQLTDVDLTDTLPAGVTLAANPAVTNTCGGTLQAFPNTGELILTGGSVAPRPDAQESSDCAITAQVTGTLVGNYQNVITPSDFSSSAGSIPANVTATLGIDTGLSGTKGFTPTAVVPGGKARVKVTLLNGFNGVLTNVSVTDPLDAGLTVANPANASTNCAGSPSLVANPGAASAELLGATLPAGGSCDFFFDVRTSGTGPWSNTIPAGNITSAEGPVSTSAISATLAQATAELSVNKSFDPVIVTGGVPSLLRIDLINPSAITMEGVGLTDTFPFGIEVYSVPDASTNCPGGQVTAIPGDNKVVLSGARIPPDATCQVFVTTTSVSFLNLTNSIAAGAVVTDQGYTNPEGTVATLSTLQGLGVTKGFSPDVIGTGQTARLRIRLISTLDPNSATPRELTGVSFTDELPDGLFIAAAANPATTCAGSGPGSAPVIDTSNAAEHGVITVSQATVPPGSNCLIELDVRADALGAYTNIIPERGVVSDQGVLNESPTQSTLNVVESPTIAKAFAAAFRNPGEPNRLTVTINNNDPTLALTGVALTDTLPAGLAIASPTNAATTCSNGQIVASPGEATLELIDATLATESSCTFSADVVGNDPGEYTNFIDAATLLSDQGLTNTGTAQATMGVGAPPAIAKAFAPVGIAPDATATLTITLTNPNAAAISLTEPLIDALPGNLFVAAQPNAGTNCGNGAVTAAAGGISVTLDTGAEIPAGGSCTVTVDVTASEEGLYENVIAAGQLQTTTGSNQAPVTASLAVSQTDPLVPPTVGKSFSPGTIAAADTATLTLSLGNPNASPLTLIADFIDTLPSGVAVADPADIGGSCSGSVTAPVGGDSITYASGAQIPAGGCTITVAVTSDTGGSYTNTIPAGALDTDGGANGDPASAGLVVTTPTPPTVEKAFAPNTINPGDVARLTIGLGNANNAAMTLSADFVDTLPAGVTVADPVDLGGTCTLSSVTASAGSSTITYANGAEIPSGGCTIALDVTASDSTASPYVNTIAAGDLQTSVGNNGAEATASLFVNPPQPPSLSKYFSPSGIVVGGTSTLTLSFGNGNLAGTTLTADLVDTLPSGVVVADNPNIQATTGCSAGSVSASAGGSTVTVQSGAPIPAGGCSISVDVTSSAPSESGHLNSIEAGALQTGFGNNAVATSARLKVSPLGIAKAVDSGTGPYAIGDEVTYTVSITVPAGIDTLNPFVVQDLTLTDALPDGLEYLTGSYVLTQSPDLDYAGPLPSDFIVDGSNLTANLGTVTNASGEAQTFTIGYRLRVEDIPGNVAGTDLTNTATVGSADTTSTWDDDATVTVGEPALGIVKAISPDTDLTAGDEVTITLTVTNSGNVPAFDVVVADILNDGTDNDLFDLAAAGISDTSTGTGADDFDFAYVEGTGTVTYTAKDGVSLAANGGQVIFTFTATVGPDIRTGWTYSNAASAVGNSQDGGTNGRETPQADSNTATVSTGVGAVSKVIDTSSESWTTGSQLAIGEVVTYRLSYTVPVGEIVSPLDAAIFADALPAGQQFLTGTASIQASADGVVTADFGAVPTSPTAVAPSVAGQDLGFDVGTVSNTGTAPAQVVILFDALVLNTSDNNHNDSKTNTATLNYVNRDDTTQSQTDTQQTTVVEPLPATTKSASPTTASGGDTVTFTVVASAATGSNRTRLWDAVVTDTLPARYQSPMLTDAELSRGNVDVTSCGGFVGQTLTLTMDCLAADQRYLGPGENITLTYTATLDPAIDFEETVTNTAELQGTSLPGSNGTGDATPGAPDSDTGERTGSGQNNTSGQAVNDLSATDNATLTANRPSVTKTVGQDALQIGATTTQTITVSVPVGQTDNFVITDELPDGLRYTGTPITIDLPASDFSTTNSPPTEPGADTDPLVFNFGTVQNSAATSQDIVISYEVEVENVIGNQRNAQLVNTATLIYSGASQPFPADDATITVREPALALSKTITDGTPAVAGDEVSYQLTVSNTDGFATAYQTDLTDVLPADLLGANGGAGPYFANVAVDNDSDAVVKSDGGDPLTAADADQTTASDTLAWPLFDLPPNTTLTITYTATVVDGAVTGAILTNNVEAAYNSLPFGSDGRNGSDVLDDTDDTQLNNYGQTTSRDLTLDANIALQKTLTTGQPDANFAIGEEVLFDVKVSLLAGVTNNVVVTDTLPDGLQFLELVGINAESGISYDGAGTAVENPTGTVTVDLGNVTIAPAVADKSLTLQLRARVDNIASNQNGVDLTNGAEVTSDIGTASDSLDVTVAEPVLQVTKTPDTTVPALGNQVTYTVEVSHTAASTADAYQVELTDLIPTGLTYQTGSTTGQASVDESDPAAPVFTLGQLANGDTKTFSYRAEVDLDAVVGSALQNVIDGTFASTADATGAPDSGRTGNDGAGGLNDYVFDTTADVTPATTAFLYPVKTVALVVDGGTSGQVDPGDTLEYTIALSNEGADATGVVFTDPMPANTTYVANSATLDGSPAGTFASNTLTIDIGDLAAGATATITFQVTVDVGTPDGTVLSNQGSVDSEQTVPTPTDADGVRDNGFEPTDIPVGGQPAVQSPLYAEKRVVLLTDVAGNGVVNPGDTLRYTLVLTNNGDESLTNVSLTDTIPTGLTYVAGTASATAGSADISGQSLDWTLSPLAAGDFEFLVFNVAVDSPLPGGVTDYTFENQGATDSDQTQPGDTDGNGDPSDGFQSTEIDATTGSGAPLLDVQKRWSLAEDGNGNGLANPGDTIGYVISVINSGSAATVDARLSDVIPANTAIVPGSVTTDIGVVTGTDPIAINLGSLLPGEVATVRFQVTIDGGVAGGTLIENQGTVSGANFADVLSDDNGNPADGRNPTQTPVVDGDPSVGTPGGLTKTLDETSEAASTGTDVLIGEVVTYQVGVQVPPGTLREAQIEDVLPAGLGYLPGSAKLSRTFTTGLNAAQNPGDINAAASDVFVDLIDGSELQQDGQTLSLLLGDVINSDATAATYTLQYQAVVLNADANVAGTTLANAATLRWLTALNQPASLTPVTQTLTVLEPGLVIAKTADPSVIVPEGTTTFTLTLTHPSGGNRATAYDVQLTDLFDNWDSIDPSSITTAPSGGVSAVDTSASTTSELNVSVGTFPVDGQLVITVEATDNGVRDDFVDNTANLTWTSLPGDQGTNDATPGAPGEADGERTGSGVAPNNYADSATERVRVVDVNFVKDLDNAQTRYAIGDEVEYRVTVTLPPDLDDLDKVVLENSVVTDVLDAGLVYVTGSLDATLQDSDITADPALPTDFTVSADTPEPGETTLTLDAGTLTNTNTTEARTLVLTYRARVADVPGNIANHTLDNAATFDFQVQGNPSAEQLSDAEQVQVGEPDITLVKTITSPTTNLDAGSTVSFQVVASNGGTTVAYDTVLGDTLPTGLRDIVNLQVTATSGGAATPTFSTFTEGDQSFASDAFDLPVGGSVTITFDATLTDDVQQGQTIQNQVLAAYDSRTGDDPNQRTYSADDLSPVITVNAEVTLDKAFHPDAGTTEYTIGEEFEYRLTLGIIEGVTRAVSVVDTLPDGVTYLSASVGLGNTGIIIGNPASQPTDVTGQVLTFSLGDITNPTNGVADDDVITIDIRVRVDNIAANVSGTVLGNNAHVDYTDGQDDAQRVDFDADAGTPGIQPLDATLVEPALELQKTADRASVALGTEVLFTLSIDHTVDSGADAFELVAVDSLPAGLTYVDGSASTAPSSVTGDSSTGQELTFELGSLTEAAGQTEVTFRALAERDLVIDQAVTNAASLTWASQSGATGAADSGRTGPLDGSDTLNDYESTSQTNVTPTTPAFLYPVKTVALVVDGGTSGQVDPGDTLEYTIELTNEGADATGVVFTDPVPANTTYVGGSLTSDVGTADDSGAPNLQVDIGDLAAGATATITFQVTVDSGTPDGTVISNQGSVDSEQTVPTPTDADGVRDNGFEPTDIPVGGQPAVQSPLYAEKRVVLLTDVAGNGVVNPGDTLRYTLVLTNNGDQDLTNVLLTDTIPTGLSYAGGSANATAGTPTVNGQSLSWSVPTLAAGDFEILVFNVEVDDPLPGGVTDYTFENQGATDSDQTQPGDTDGNGDPSDGFQPTEIDATTGSGAPLLDVQKRWSLAEDGNGNGLANPGDTIGYVISVINSGSAATVDARLSDVIPTNTAIVPGSVTTDIGVVTGTDPIAINLGSLLPGEVATVRFQVSIDGGVAGGTLIENQGTVSGDNFADVLSDDNGNPADGRNPTQTPVVDGDPSVGTPGGLTKSLVETSEAASTGTDVLIGEVVTYQVGVQVPPGTLREAQIEDVLPAGLGYLPGSAKLSRSFSTGLNAAQNPGDINAAASDVFVDLIDGSELQQDGQTLSLLLGDVINSDGAAATYTLQYQAVVLNAADNLVGTTLTNQGTLRWLTAVNQPASLTPVNQTLTVLEPGLVIAKTVDPDVILPDGETTFTLTITHPDNGNGAPAYDVVLTDLFDEWDSIDAAGIALTPSGGVLNADSSTSTDNKLNVTVGTFPVGGELIVTVIATGDGVEGEYFNNTANLTWTSLPGEQGTNDATPGQPGEGDGERTGSGGTNSYADSDTAQVRAVAVAFDKDLDNAQARYAIGDLVEYRVIVTLPPDVDDLGKVVLENSVVTDVLDAGLVYLPSSFSATLQDSDITSTEPLTGFTVEDDTPSAGQTTLTLDAGTLTNANTTEARTLVLTYQARVADVAGNENNQVLDNAAQFDFKLRDNPNNEQLTDAEQVQVGEPDIDLAKTITSPTTNLDAGSVVDFQVVATNNGTTVAYDTVLSDTLPTGLRDITSLEVSNTSGGAPTPTFAGFTDGDQAFTSDPFDLPVGGSVTLTFSATLTNDVQQGQTIQNQVLADYDSRSGDDPNQRSYSADDLSPIIPVDVPVTLDKAFHPDPAQTEYTIGEEFEYRLTLGIIEGVTRAVSIVDELPAGVSFLEATVGLGNTGMSTENPIGVSDQPTTVDGTNLTGETLTFDLGDVTNPTNGVGDDDVITVDIRVRVDNLAANQNGDTLGNFTHVNYTDADDQSQRVDFDADAGETDIQPLEATVVEPALELTKTPDRTSVALGTEVVFTLSIAHTGASASDAFDLVVADTLPAGLTYVDGSASPAPSSVSGDSSTGQELTFALGSLTTAAGQTQVTFRALAERDLVIDQAVTNTASLTWASLADATGAEDSGRTGPLDGSDTLNDYQSTSESDVTPSTDAFIDPVKTVTLSNDLESNGQVDPGDTLSYSIVLESQSPDVTATNVVFTDPIPVNTTYVGGSLSTTQGSPDDSGDPLVVNVGDMIPGATVTIGFDVTVNSGVADGTIIANQGSVVSDQTVPTPTDDDGVREPSPSPTEIPVGPATANALYVTKTATLTNDTVAPTGTINEGDEVTYQIVLRNTGASDLTNLSFSDTVPSGPSPTGMNVTAITTTQGTAPSATNSIVIDDIGTLAPNGTVVITIVGTANGTGTVSNQASTEASELDEPVLSDGDDDPTNGEQPTDFPVLAAGDSGEPVLALDKRAELIGDTNGDGYANPGETLRFVVTLRNTGSIAATDVQFSDDLDATRGTFLPDSLAISQGVLLDLGPPLRINIGTLAPGAIETVSYLVTVDSLGGSLGLLMQNIATIQDIDDREAEASAQVPILVPQAPISDPARNTVIGNRVWLDENGDGVQDAGEAGIANALVELYEAGQTPGVDTPIATMLTDADGGYLFEVDPGSYLVAVVPPAGLDPTFDEDGTATPDQIDNITVDAGDEHLTADFGYNWVPPTDSTNPPQGATGAIGDRIWNDADGDGVQDPGEAGIGGVSVTILYDPDGDGVYDTPYTAATDADGNTITTGTTTTDASGNYIFDNLPSAGYVIEVVPPAGFDPAPTGDPDNDGDNTSLPIPLAPGDVFVNADFGYQLTGGGSAIGDRIWLDVDGDGLQDGDEPGIAGVTVSLVDPDLGQVIATTTTDENGEYLFPGLADDTYQVFVDDIANVLGEQAQTADPDGTLDRRSTVTLTGSDNLDQDFGFAPNGAAPGVGYIGDTIFLDTGDGAGGPPDGQYQPGEGLEGVRVDLYDGSGLVIRATTYTDENGFYGFGDLDADATYQVRVDTDTLPGAGADLTNTVDPDGNGDSRSVRDLALIGPVDRAADFGYQPAVANRIEGTIWADNNADGLLTDGAGDTPDETGNGFDGVTVVLHSDLNGDGVIDGNDPIVAQTTTDADGSYSFPNLPNGDYLVQVTDNDGLLSGYWHSTGPTPGANDNSQATPYAVSLSGGQVNDTADFGYYRTLAAVGNRVWLDMNDNGIQDPGEPDADDVPVELTLTYPNGDVVSVFTRTDENGFYSFANLLADEQFNGLGTAGAGGDTPLHEISIIPPFGYEPSPIGQGTDPLLDSNDPAGTEAIVFQGEDDVTAQPDPADETPYAGYDFGFFATCTAICDVSDDAAVNRMDLMLIFRQRGQRVTPPGLPNSGDCNRDGIVSINDVRACLRFQTP